MAYKDKDKQKEANRLANKRYRDNKAKGITEGITNESITITPGVIPDGTTDISNIKSLHRPITKRSLARPGDADYQEHTGPDEPCCVCGDALPRLEQPRQHKGMCLPCVMTKAQHSQQPAEGASV